MVCHLRFSDANERIGDGWQNRWDSLRLFTPLRFDGLDGMPFPAPTPSPQRMRWRIGQFHSRKLSEPGAVEGWRRPDWGAGNSGAEIASETGRKHRTCASGRDAGHIPFHIHGLAGRLFLTRFVLRFVFHRVLTVKTLLGRKARPKILSQGGPLIRVKPDDLRAAGPIFLSLGANS